MELGAVFPTNEIGSDPLALRDWAQAAEGLGYDRIIAYDHVLGAAHADRDPKLWGPYTERDPFHEPFVLFGWMAAFTTRIKLMTGVIIMPQRQTALVAKQAAQVQLLSGGRLLLGLGTGWNYVEYDALGVPYAGRGRRLDEQVELLKRLFTEPIVDFSGSYHRVDRAGIVPLPPAPIPIWFGGGTDAALERAARVGDGFVWGSAGDRCRTQLATVQSRLQAHGRDPAAFGADQIIDHAAGPTEWAKEHDRWAEAGGTCFSMQTMDIIYRWRGGTPNGFTTPAEHIAALERFVRVLRG